IACCWTPIPRIHSAMPSQVITAMLPNDRLRGPAHDTTSGNTPQCPQGPLEPPVRRQVPHAGLSATTRRRHYMPHALAQHSNQNARRLLLGYQNESTSLLASETLGGLERASS